MDYDRHRERVIVVILRVYGSIDTRLIFGAISFLFAFLQNVSIIYFSFFKLKQFYDSLGSKYLYSAIPTIFCIRLLPSSTTNIFPEESAPKPAGLLNSPSPVPGVPYFDIKVPLLSNFCIR